MDHGSFEFMSASQPAEGRRRAPAAAVVAFVLAAFQAWFVGRLRRSGDALVEAPTGAGKTLLVRTLVALDLDQPGGFSHAVIACPQEQIERGFLRDHDTTVAWPAGLAAQPTIVIPARLFRAARRDGCGTAPSIRRYLAAAARSYALVCTHAALARLDQNDLPQDLTNRILVIDEAHHCPAAGLARVARLWRSRGGRLVFFSATPFRNDEKPVLLPGMIHLRRSLVEHMEEGWAPRTLASEIIALGRSSQRVRSRQFTGDIPPPRSYTKATARALIEKWIADGRPKTIVRVPPGRGALVRRVVAAFEAAGARVLDATGVGPERKHRFLEALDAERQRGTSGSRIDVIVGILRVLEGTDWPVCSTVYSVGIPRSLQVVMQLVGRALRKKGDDYPAAYRDLARLVF
ncbi:MAG: DEAD/DEAH box helicase family protein, partial [Planctomycetota bacterium]|nr:DEAD/DEAH box helicase family protein [Planctomycetota bacterium]